jgi:uncharacterized protein YndB with AHSA1/START domain
METTGKTVITVKTSVNTSIEEAWKLWTLPEHIVKWNFASDDWHSPKAENDLRIGGKFNFRMEAKDGSFGFDFGGVYDEVVINERINYTIGDERKVEIIFSSEKGHTEITETFEAEDQNPAGMQEAGWQAILDNYKKYAEQFNEI